MADLVPTNIKVNSNIIKEFTTPISAIENRNRYLKTDENGNITYYTAEDIANEIQYGPTGNRFGDWLQNNYYKEGDCVVYELTVYRAKNDHTSSSIFFDDITAHWDIVAGYSKEHIYAYDETNPITQLSLGQVVADKNSIMVNVNNLLLQSNNYYLNSTRDTVVFSTPIEADNNIEIIIFGNMSIPNNITEIIIKPFTVSIDGTTDFYLGGTPVPSSKETVIVNIDNTVILQSEFELVKTTVDNDTLRLNNPVNIGTRVQVSFFNGLIIGAQGPQGIPGVQGPIGPSAVDIMVGTTTTGNSGTNASVTNIGTPKSPILEFTIPQGPQGIQGPQGEQGIPGVQGPIGLTGIQGPIGPQGLRGEKGEQGDRGIMGPQGIQGPSGPIGPRGNVGATGPIGPQGNPLKLLGEKASEADLPLVGNSIGDTYLINGIAWEWYSLTQIASEAQWYNTSARVKGDIGFTFTPHLTSLSDEQTKLVLSWTNNGELPNPEDVEIIDTTDINSYEVRTTVLNDILVPNNYYKLGDITETTLTLKDEVKPNYISEFMFSFISPSSSVNGSKIYLIPNVSTTSFSIKGDVVSWGYEDTKCYFIVEKGYKYQTSILDGTVIVSGTIL